MTGRTLLTVSSIVLFVTGGLALFTSEEVGNLAGIEVSVPTRFLAELAGIGMVALAAQIGCPETDRLAGCIHAPWVLRT